MLLRSSLPTFHIFQYMLFPSRHIDAAPFADIDTFSILYIVFVFSRCMRDMLGSLNYSSGYVYISFVLISYKHFCFPRELI
jgi:hypothetical protein